MKVKVHQAVLTIESRRKTLTKVVAKQFPVRPLDARRQGGIVVSKPICKVQGRVLGNVAQWLYLVEDDVAGLAWEPAVVYHEAYGRKMKEAGYHVDDPGDVPTVVL